MFEGMARVRATRRQLQEVLGEREQRCEDDDDDYCHIIDTNMDQAEDEAEGNIWGDFGDDTFSPDTDDENDESNGQTDDDIERMTETIAYEVIGELMAGGAIDRSIFFDDDGRQYAII
ncbi:hypothetical protein SEMRO_378_G130210.1 [Seminavis robusta]|uniref:Uncharacterized protein n=1 Tax=Seminavis robusta TaxID=568900 RepID=A0A9N8DUD1_9STRA|nr:hypothetical protein SEMRO_378_G130210.1 [Seminavis robusta]|eukprot:Sro378_g130210.1 n/a (118) ;mRNA; r:16939-17292